MAQFEIIEETNPTDVYGNPELQDEYTQLLVDGEPIAVIIPFQKEQTQIDTLIEDNPESKNETINFSETIESEAGLYDNFISNEERLSPEEEKEKLKELKLKILESEKDKHSLKEPKNINYITEADINKIPFDKIAYDLDDTSKAVEQIRNAPVEIQNKFQEEVDAGERISPDLRDSIRVWVMDNRIDLSSKFPYLKDENSIDWNEVDWVRIGNILTSED